MVNRPRADGTWAESAVAAYLQANGFPWAERRTLKGRLDQGDITGTPGIAWEVKYANGGLRVAEWVRQTEDERVNANADFGICVAKPRGLGARSVGHWYTVMSYESHEKLVALARANQDDLNLIIGAPFGFSAQAVALHLAAQKVISAQRWDAGVLFAVTAAPPGAKNAPERHYRLMHLSDMVQLLHHAGYGS